MAWSERGVQGGLGDGVLRSEWLGARSADWSGDAAVVEGHTRL